MRTEGNADPYDQLALAILDEPKAYPKLDVVNSKKLENDKKMEKKQLSKEKVIDAIMSSEEEEEEEVNDDELESKYKREKGIMKHVRKVRNLNSFIDRIKTIKSDKTGRRGDDEEGSYDEDGNDETDSLGEIDLDGDEDEEDNEDGEEDEDEEESEESEEDGSENVDLPDEYESEGKDYANESD